MPSARKRDARSPTPRTAGRAAPGTDPPGQHRRWWLAAAGGTAVMLGVVLALRSLTSFTAASRQADLRAIRNQNVLLITIDTLRADALHSYGGRAATPALDRLAAQGVRFDYAHAHAVLTFPSHASILTGLYPFQHGIRDNSGYRLAANARTAATMLKQAGYATGAFVAAFPLNARFGLNVGFDVYDDRFGETRAPTEFVMPERPATSVVALARAWIAAQRQREGPLRPWFAWVHVFEPHAPYRPPPPFDTQYEHPYDGEVAATDAALAPLLADVGAGDRSTLVIVTGDHGEALGDHGEQTHGLFAYESTLRIPLVIAEVGAQIGAEVGARVGAQAGVEVGAQSTGPTPSLPSLPREVSSVAARHIDILPTLLEAVAQPVPADLPGRSLLPPAERRTGSPRASYFEAMSAMLNRGWAPLSGVLVDRDKYIDLPIAERYDLAGDTGESTNLAGRAPDRDRTLDDVLRGFNPPLPGRRRTEEPDVAARLRSLGYVAGDAPIKARYTDADDPKTLVAIDEEFHRAVDLYVGRRYEDAKVIYRQIIARRPDMAIAYRHLAFVSWETGQTREAIDLLQRALAAGVTSVPVMTQLGTYLAESGNPSAAIPLLEPIAVGQTADLDAVNGLGIAYARAGRAEDARQTFERMLTLDSSNAMALVNLGALDLERGDPASARRRFERAAEADPTSSSALSGLGVVAFKTGDGDRAVAEWTRAVELDPTNYDALYNLATTLVGSGHLAEARPYLERFARSAPPAFYARDIREVNTILQRQSVPR